MKDATVEKSPPSSVTAAIAEPTAPEDAPPPDVVLQHLTEPQRDAFKTLRGKLPTHLQQVNFDFDSSLW